MDLVEVDHVHFEPAEARFAFASNRFLAERVVHFALSVPDHAAFGEDVGSWPLPFPQCPSNDLLRMAQTINGGCINPVYAQFERAMNSRNRLCVILCAPPEFPITADGPGTKADGCNVQIRISEHFGFHCFL